METVRVSAASHPLPAPGTPGARREGAHSRGSLDRTPSPAPPLPQSGEAAEAFRGTGYQPVVGDGCKTQHGFGLGKPGFAVENKRLRPRARNASATRVGVSRHHPSPGKTHPQARASRPCHAACASPGAPEERGKGAPALPRIIGGGGKRRGPQYHETHALLPAVIALLLLIAAPLVRAADAPFEKEIRAFEAADAKQPPPKNAILFLGSSSIRFWTTLADDFPDRQVINRGFGGSEIADSTRYADRIVIPYHPRQIVMYAGDNDLAKGKSPQQVAGDFKAFVQKVRAALPDVRISYIAIKPSIQRWKLVDKIREADRLIREYAAGEKNIDYIDVFTPMLDSQGMPRKELFRDDGLHLNRKGYELWVSLVRPYLQGPSSR